ncbi:MAG: hypothetical protein JWR11_318 [Mycobacterium sp.]|nr:hypothetical protein [Mycobacterium sp.]
MAKVVSCERGRAPTIAFSPALRTRIEKEVAATRPSSTARVRDCASEPSLSKGRRPPLRASRTIAPRDNTGGRKYAATPAAGAALPASPAPLVHQNSSATSQLAMAAMTSTRHQREAPDARRATTAAQTITAMPMTAWSAPTTQRAASSPNGASAFTPASAATPANARRRNGFPKIDTKSPVPGGVDERPILARRSCWQSPLQSADRPVGPAAPARATGEVDRSSPQSARVCKCPPHSDNPRQPDRAYSRRGRPSSVGPSPQVPTS